MVHRLMILRHCMWFPHIYIIDIYLYMYIYIYIFIYTPRVQVPNNHILSKILTYITTILNPSTLLLSPLDLLEYMCVMHIHGIYIYMYYFMYSHKHIELCMYIHIHIHIPAFLLYSISTRACKAIAS